MTTSKWLLLVAVLGGLSACAGDDGGGAGDGDDTLPKRGELASDPTIVSAVANCSCSGEICSGGDTNTHVRVRVAASDPMGVGNLGNCAGTLAGITDQDSYGDGSAGSDCYLYFQTTCTAGAVHTVALTVSNDTGGVTTASIKVTVAP